jgi:hypothetical protein
VSENMSNNARIGQVYSETETSPPIHAVQIKTGQVVDQERMAANASDRPAIASNRDT